MRRGAPGRPAAWAEWERPYFEGWTEEAPSQVSLPSPGQQTTCPFWSARNLLLSGDIFWHLVVFSPVAFFCYFMCMSCCPETLAIFSKAGIWQVSYMKDTDFFFAFSLHFLKLGCVASCHQAVFKQYNKWGAEPLFVLLSCASASLRELPSPTGQNRHMNEAEPPQLIHRCANEKYLLSTTCYWDFAVVTQHLFLLFLLKYTLYTMKCLDLRYTFNQLWQMHSLV